MNNESGSSSAFLKSRLQFMLALKETVSSRLHRVLISVMLLYCFIVWVMGQAMNKPTLISFFTYENLMINSTVVFFIGMIFGRLFYIMIFKRPRRLFRAIKEDIIHLLTWRRILMAAPLLIMFPIFFSAFTSFKTLIPVMIPYSYDPLFWKLDKWLHFGVDPWRLLQPFIGFFFVSFVIGFVYKFWFFVKFMCLYWMGFTVDKSSLRAQFFIAYLISWIVNGTFFALIFSSGGPCFYALITGEAVDPYLPLFDYLRAANEHWPIWALQGQAFLWEIYQGQHSGMMAGISAMPSMHVSVALMLLFAGWHYGPLTKAFFIAFFMFTLIGSVHLGWHYAIDGYFSILTTWIIWRMSERIVLKFNLGGT